MLIGVDSSAYGRRTGDSMPSWYGGLKRKYESSKWLIERIKDGRKVWVESLRLDAPAGVDPSNQHNIGDAYRHYMTSAALARALKDIFGDAFGTALANSAGDILEIIGKNPPLDKEMDVNSNHLGVAASDRGVNSFDDRMNFFIDALKGNIKIIDKDPFSGKDVIRSSDFTDLPHHDGDRLEDHYRPDTGRNPTMEA